MVNKTGLQPVEQILVFFQKIFKITKKGIIIRENGAKSGRKMFKIQTKISDFELSGF